MFNNLFGGVIYISLLSVFTLNNKTTANVMQRNERKTFIACFIVFVYAIKRDKTPRNISITGFLEAFQSVLDSALHAGYLSIFEHPLCALVLPWTRVKFKSLEGRKRREFSKAAGGKTPRVFVYQLLLNRWFKSVLQGSFSFFWWMKDDLKMFVVEYFNRN